MRTPKYVFARLLLLLALLASNALAQATYRLETLYDGLDKPVSLLTLDDGSMLVSSLNGQVYLLRDGLVRDALVLDLSARVTALQGEQGFYGVALEPAAAAAAAGRPRWLVGAFAERDTGDLVVSAFPFDDESGSAEADGEVVLLRVPMPEPFHYGGHVRFGPDGMLWASVGNGESSNVYLHQRPFSSQDLSTLRGKLLRLDLSGTGARGTYAVPADNPFVGVAGARPEIYAYGFRNPWKFTFHPGTGEVVLTDVGNDRWEEVNVVVRGGDHGWPRREGFECQYLPDAPGLVNAACESMPFVPPAHAYGHLALDPAGGQAVVGGVVIEGASAAGTYVFGDFVVGRIWSLDLSSGEATELLDTDLPITQIAMGPDGEVLVVSISGSVARLLADP